jgi:dCMP deaminase
MDMAEFVATKSKDKSSKIGCVIVGPKNDVRSTGYNGFPRGVNDDVEERHERPEKYFWTEHAERNAIYNAARFGAQLDGCTAYIHGNHPPCAECARALIQSGIVRVVVSDQTKNSEKWMESFKRSLIMFEETNTAGYYHTKKTKQ